MPAEPDAEVVGTFHAPPYEVLLLDLQGEAVHVNIALHQVYARVACNMLC